MYSTHSSSEIQPEESISQVNSDSFGEGLHQPATSSIASNVLPIRPIDFVGVKRGNEQCREPMDYNYMELNRGEMTTQSSSTDS